MILLKNRGMEIQSVRELTQMKFYETVIIPKLTWAQR
jgi:hypothetical protein